MFPNFEKFTLMKQTETTTSDSTSTNTVLAVSGPLLSFLEWLTANYDFVDGDWYYKTDLDGDNPLSHSNILYCYQAACASGAVDKTVSDGLCDFIEGQKCDCKIGEHCKGIQ